MTTPGELLKERTMEIELMTMDEIAALCRVPYRTVAEKWSFRQDFPRAYKPGKRKMYDRKEIVEWLRSQRKSA